MLEELKQALELHKQKKFNQAEKIYLDILIKYGQNFETLQLLGTLYLQIGKNNNSEKYLTKAYKINSNNSNVLNNLGILYKNNKDFNKAEVFFKKNIKINDHLDSKINLGNTLILSEKFKEALNLFIDLSKISNDLKVLNGLAWSYYLNGFYLKSENLFESIFSKNIFYDEMYRNYSLVLNKLKKYEQALRVINKVLFYNKSDFEALIIRSETYLNLSQNDSAEKDLLDAKELQPKNPKILSALTEYYKKNNFFDKIEKLLENIDFNDENYSELSIKFLRAKLNCCSWNDLDSLKNIITKLIEKNVPLDPLSLKFVVDDESCHFKASENFWKKKYNFENFNFNFSKIQNDKIKIGYFSPDFGDHAVTHHALKLFTNFNRNDFEICCFSSFLRNDAYKDKIKNNVDKFIDIENKNNFEVLQILDNENLDIAVDLGGHTQNSASKFFQYPIAKKKIIYLGYPGTMGSKDSYDYILCDQNIVPEKETKYYFEQMLYLDGCFTDLGQINEFKDLKRSDYNLPDNVILIGSMNRTDKLLPEFFDIWMSVINRSNNIFLCIPRVSDSAELNLKKHCQNKKFNFNKIIFLKRLQTREDYLKRLSLLDFSLDSFPYNGHTISLDNLRSGVPVITIPGHSYASRVTFSLLKNLKLTELISETLDDYKNKIKFYSENKEELKKIKKKIIYNFKIYNQSNNFVKNVEDLYKKILN